MTKFKELFEAEPDRNKIIKSLSKFKTEKYKDYSKRDVMDHVISDLKKKFGYNLKQAEDWIDNNIYDTIDYYCQKGSQCKGSR